MLREFWDSLVDYPNLDFVGNVASGPGSTKLVLSSSKEAVAYMSRSIVEPYSSKTYAAQQMKLAQLKLADDAATRIGGQVLR